MSPWLLTKTIEEILCERHLVIFYLWIIDIRHVLYFNRKDSEWIKYIDREQMRGSKKTDSLQDFLELLLPDLIFKKFFMALKLKVEKIITSLNKVTVD